MVLLVSASAAYYGYNHVAEAYITINDEDSGIETLMLSDNEWVESLYLDINKSDVVIQ